MVKPVLALVASLVVASEFDQTQMLQRSTRKSVTRHVSADRVSWQDEQTACGRLELDYSVCPYSVMEDLEQSFNDDKDALDLVISGLETDIAAKETETEMAENKTESLQAATAKALAKAAKAEADIVLVQEKMQTLQTKFDGTLEKLETSLATVAAKVNTVQQNIENLVGFVDPPMLDANDDGDTNDDGSNDTSLIQRNQNRWFWSRTKAATIMEFVQKAVKAKIIEIKDVVVEKTSEVLDDNDQIFQIKVEEARTEFKSEIADLDATVSSLKLALADEVNDLTNALAAQQEAQQNKTEAKAHAAQVRETLDGLKQQFTDMKIVNKQKISNLKNSIAAFKIWLEAFTTRFSKGLLKAMSQEY